MQRLLLTMAFSLGTKGEFLISPKNVYKKLIFIIKIKSTYREPLIPKS